MSIDTQKIAKKLGLSLENTNRWMLKFADYSPRYLGPLNEGAREKDFDKLVLAANQLHGAAALLGIDCLIDLSDQIYQQARCKQDIDYLLLVNNIQDVVDSIKTRL